MAYYLTFYPIAQKDGSTAYVSPQIRVEKSESGSYQYRNAGYDPLWRRLWRLAAIAGTIATAIIYWRGRRNGNIRPESFAESCCFALGVVLLRHALLLTLLIGGGNICCSASDDPGYFQVGSDLLQGRIDGPWSYPIGHGALFFLPFIRLLGASNFYDIALPFAWFSGFFLAPATLLMGFAVLRKLGMKNRNSLFAMILLAILPFFYHYLPLWSAGVFTSGVVPMSSAMNMPYYNAMIMSGFNAMSDTPSNFMLVGVILLTLVLPDRIRYVGGVGLLFALCCTVRVNNILFAPVIAYLLFRRYVVRPEDWRRLGLVIVSGAVGFLLGILPQLLVNWHQFGAPLTFGYILHGAALPELERPAAGFTLHTFLKFINMQFLAESNFMVWVLAISGLLTMRRRYWRNVFALWAIPVIIFFFGYSHTFCDAYRFILSAFLPLFAGFCGCEVWNDLPVRERILLGILVFAACIGMIPNVIYVENFDPFFLTKSYFQHLFQFIMPVAALLLIYRFRQLGQRRAACFLLIFAVLFSMGTAWMLALLLAVILLRALADVGREIIGAPSGEMCSPAASTSAPESAGRDREYPSGE